MRRQAGRQPGLCHWRLCGAVSLVGSPCLAHPHTPAVCWVQEEEEEPAALEWHPHARQHQYALPGREAPLLLQSRVGGWGGVGQGDGWRLELSAGFCGCAGPKESCCSARGVRAEPRCRPLPRAAQEQAQGKSGLVPGFVRATVAVVFAYFPPPRVPPGYVPLHRPSRDTEAALPAGEAEPASLGGMFFLSCGQFAAWSDSECSIPPAG